ncbi:MAG: hypothetical protein QOK37_1853 [Thermoanaerobaculia bacterium]|jgi:hypothetical protein|nr:hypothetical protein [Thermoanaerobaculia bacterium]
MERVCSSTVLGLAVWIGSLWLLGLTHLLTREALTARTILAALLAIVLWIKRRREASAETQNREHFDLLVFCALAPIALWTLFALWKGFVAPPLSHDALSYHLPKAVLFARAQGYEYLAQLHVVPRKLPSNYELLLADVIITTGSDRITEWLSTIHYLLLVAAGVALVQRWWGSDAKRDAIVALLIAQIPVALLQSSAHKNDLLLAFLVVCALMWGARFTATGETPAAILMIAAMAMAVGTKPQAVFVAVALAPFVIWRLWRGRDRRRFAALALASIVALSLLGGASYAIDFAHELSSPAVRESGNAVTTFGFTDFANIWQAPYVLIAAPFSRDDLSLFVRWEAHPWFWRRYEIYFSHLGVGVSLALLALPLAIARLRRELSLERVAGTAVALIAFVAMLPVVTIPHGLYTISLPRYALFIVPVVLGWSVEAAARARESVARISLVVFSALFVVYAIDNAVNDGFAPLRYVIWASDNPGTRLVPFSPNRAPCIVDRIAGPHDKIAIDAGFSSWIYPAFGRYLTRPVQLLPSGKPLRIDPDARWIVIDRGYEEAWNKASFRDLSQVSRLPTRGSVSPAGQELMRQALAVPGFRPVFVNASGGQAVLLRR